MYVLAALLAGFVVVPWLFICLAPLVLLVGSFFVMASGALKLASRARHLLDDQPVAEVSPKHRVLVVDDDLASVLPLIGLLQDRHADVNYVSSGEDMIQELQLDTYDIVFLDSRMPNMTGEVALAVGDQVLSLARKQSVIFYSSYVTPLEVPSDLKHFEVKDAWKKADLQSLKSNLTELFTSQPRIVA